MGATVVKRLTLTGMAALPDKGGRSTLKPVDTRCSGPSGAGSQSCGGHGGHAGSQQGWALLLRADQLSGAQWPRGASWGCLEAACRLGPMNLAPSSRWPEMVVRVPCGQAAPSGMGSGTEGGCGSMGCWPTVGAKRAGQGGNS